MSDGRDLYVLAPWEGSAFQALGLELSLTELNRPSWRKLLENVVDVEIDYATRHKLPGFLSESYSGEGVAVHRQRRHPRRSPSPPCPGSPTPPRSTPWARPTRSPPTKIEQFLAANWPSISTLLTDHGPWEGYNGARQEIILFQTTAHTLSLILGLLGTASDHMKTYLDSKGLGAEARPSSSPARRSTCSPTQTQVFAWDDKTSPIRNKRDDTGFHTHADRLKNAGIAFVPSGTHGVNLSGGLLDSPLSLVRSRCPGL